MKTLYRLVVISVDASDKTRHVLVPIGKDSIEVILDSDGNPTKLAEHEKLFSVEIDHENILIIAPLTLRYYGEEQKAKLVALKARYGKSDEDADSRRERLEENHHRRMMGLYSESGRKQEQKRHEEALKELAYREEEAALLEA